MKFGTLQVRENEIPLRNWSGGSAQLRASEGTLVFTKQSQAENKPIVWRSLQK